MPPYRPAAAGFFDSLRRTGLVRPDERWIGGVAGGVARRLGLDPTLVRCVWVVLTVFTGLGLVLYGLGWALMPEESDGRIHLEQALGGDFDAGFAGAVATFISGWVVLDHGLLPSWYVRGWLGWGYHDVFWSFVGTFLVLAAVFWCYRAARRHGRPYQPRPMPTGGFGYPGPTSAPSAAPPHYRPQAPTSQPGTPTPGTPTPGTPTPGTPGHHTNPRVAGAPTPAGPAGAPVFAVPAGGPAPRPVAPVQPRRPGPERRLALSIAGVILCCLAAIVLLWYLDDMGPLAAWLAAVGSVTAILGAGVTISALRGRRGGWMTALGWLAAMVAVPALVFGTSVPQGALTSRDTTWRLPTHTVTLTWDDLKRQFAGTHGDANTTVILGDYAVGQVVIDLTGMPSGQEPRVRAALSVGAGSVTIRTSAEQNLAVDSTVGLGTTYANTTSDWSINDGVISDHSVWQRNRYTVDGDSVPTYRSERWYPGEKISFTSPVARQTGTALRLDIEVGAGAVNIDERPNQVTWYGVPDSTAWIVESWVDENGNSHGSLPVTGMTHAAIDTDTAIKCSDAVTDALEESAASDDADDLDDWEDHGWYGGDWYTVPDLVGVGRRAWDDCVGEALRAETETGASGSSAEPSGAPSGVAEPSQSATTAEPTATATH